MFRGFAITTAGKGRDTFSRGGQPNFEELQKIIANFICNRPFHLKSQMYKLFEGEVKEMLRLIMR